VNEGDWIIPVFFYGKEHVFFMPEIINEWVGYNGKMTEEKKPDGTIKKLKHNKVWAAALTDTGHIYVRYGPAKHPLKLTEQIIRPKRDLSESEALTEAERLFHEKVQEKLYQKGYDAISFEVAPHFVPSFSKWRMSDEPEEIVASIHEMGTPPSEMIVDSLQNILHDLSERFLQDPCSQCGTCHRRYLVDLGDGKTYTPETVISLLSQTSQGTEWLLVPCRCKEQALLHAETQELLAIIVDLASGSGECALKSNSASA
jgi:hypothetical protein